MTVIIGSCICWLRYMLTYVYKVWIEYIYNTVFSCFLQDLHCSLPRDQSWPSWNSHVWNPGITFAAYLHNFWAFILAYFSWSNNNVSQNLHSFRRIKFKMQLGLLPIFGIIHSPTLSENLLSTIVTNTPDRVWCLRWTQLTISMWSSAKQLP